MGDVSILIDKNGNVIDLNKNKDKNTTNTGKGTDTIDNEDGDTVDEDELSGSGSSALPTTPESIFTPTAPIKEEISSSKEKDSGNVAVIAAAVSGAIILIVLIIVLIIFCRRRRRRQREKANNTKPLPHPASMDMSESSRTTLPVRPTGDGYYTAVPLTAMYPPTAEGEELPPPVEPPPPPPSSKTSPSNSKVSARYTKLKSRAGATASAPPLEKSENIYETIDDYADNGAVGGSPPQVDCEVYLVASNPKDSGGGAEGCEDEYKDTDKLKC